MNVQAIMCVLCQYVHLWQQTHKHSQQHIDSLSPGNKEYAPSAPQNHPIGNTNALYIMSYLAGSFKSEQTISNVKTCTRLILRFVKKKVHSIQQSMLLIILGPVKDF